MFNLIIIVMKKQILKRIGTAIINGLPMIQSIKQAIKPEDPANINSTEPKVNKVDATLILQILVEGAVVVGILWAATKLGVTTEDIKSLWGIIK